MTRTNMQLYERLSERFAKLAATASTSTKRLASASSRSRTPVAPKSKPQSRRDLKLSATVRKQLRIAELMKLAERHGAVDLALGRLAAGFPLAEIAAEITGEGMPSRVSPIIAAYSGARGMAPARSAARTAEAAAIIAAGEKAVRLPR